LINLALKSLALGLVAGLSPGPLTTLAIAETVQKSKRDGRLIAVVPILTDLPIIIASIYLLRGLDNLNYAVGIISFLGGIFLLFLAVKTYRSELNPNLSNSNSGGSLMKGIITNYLNPNPYIFWVTVGAPTIILENGYQIRNAFIFVFCFYTGLIGVKFIIVELTSKSKEFFSLKSLRLAGKLLALLLSVFAVQFFIETYNRIF